VTDLLERRWGQRGVLEGSSKNPTSPAFLRRWMLLSRDARGSGSAGIQQLARTMAGTQAIPGVLLVGKPGHKSLLQAMGSKLAGVFIGKPTKKKTVMLGIQANGNSAEFPKGRSSGTLGSGR